MAGGLPFAAPIGATSRAGSQSVRPADPAEQPKLSGYFAMPATDRPTPTIKPPEPGRLSTASQKGQRQMSQRNGQPSQRQMPTSGRPVSVSLDAVFEDLTVTVPGSPTNLPAHSQSISSPAKARPLSPQAVILARARTEIKEIVVGADALSRRSLPGSSHRGAARRELPGGRATDASALTAARDKQNAAGLGRAPSALASERAKSVALGRQPAYTPPYEQMQQQSRLPPRPPPRPPAAAEPGMPVPARLPRPVTKEAPGLTLDA